MGEMNSRAGLAVGDTPDERGPLARLSVALALSCGAWQRLGVGRARWAGERGKKGSKSGRPEKGEG